MYRIGHNILMTFQDWLKAQGFRFFITPTPEQLLSRPDSLTPTQRQWLQAFIKERTTA